MLNGEERVITFQGLAMADPEREYVSMNEGERDDATESGEPPSKKARLDNDAGGQTVVADTCQEAATLAPSATSVETPVAPSAPSDPPACDPAAAEAAAVPAAVPDPASAPAVTPGAALTEAFKRYKKRKIAMFCGYNGAKYQGMQRNPGAITIEGELERALFKAGAIQDTNFGDPRKVDWNRAARTDKGVSALCQVVSARMFIDPPGFVERVNKELPPAIRLFGFVRVTNGFHAKNQCERRRYEYVLPTWAFDPNSHKGRQTYMRWQEEQAARGQLAEGQVVAGQVADGQVAGAQVVEEKIGDGEPEAGQPSEGQPSGQASVGQVAAGHVAAEGEREERGTEPRRMSDTAEGKRSEEPANERVKSNHPCLAPSSNGDVPPGKMDLELTPRVASSTKAVIAGDTEICGEMPTLGPAAETVVPAGNGEEDEVSSLDASLKANVAPSAGDGNLPEAAKDNNSKPAPIPSAPELSTAANGAVPSSTDPAQQAVDKADTESNPSSSQSRPKFVFDESVEARMNELLHQFTGTHNFHNFTARVRPEDPSCNRYIISFQCAGTFEVGGVQFVRCQVLGQSFMLHQIRKMIGMALAIMRGCAPASLLRKALRKDRNVNVPMAPELGLFLEECFYPGYNNRFASTHDSLTINKFRDQVDEFKQTVIYPHIAGTEAKDHTLANWIYNLNDRNYPDFATAWEEERKLSGEAKKELNGSKE
eukprot:TRINITY_DN1956_c0_g5_i1.p1 TRINITY_DN1956_c0_g5~~TRINITY_DN1956_c0_g5_i1.p1  ORF type:complete len:710 (+),score=141.78 TRINITY_DN1956_c0_g5_i1:185-2314(+)